jgi:hypothetical protein
MANSRIGTPAFTAEGSFEQTLVEVWRQALVENAEVVELRTKRYPVRKPPKRRLRQVDFVFNRNEVRGLEQNPETKSRWAQMARSGKKVMQFLSEGHYVANVVEGKVNFYRKGPGTSRCGTAQFEMGLTYVMGIANEASCGPVCRFTEFGPATFSQNDRLFVPFWLAPLFKHH